MRKKPSFFVSSVGYGLQPYRENICGIISEEFQWPCDASGIKETRFGGPPKQGCFTVLEASDVYLGFFWKDAGSIVPSAGSFMTELEFHHALNLRKYVRLYVVHARHRDWYLENFLDQTAGDAEQGQYIRFCRNWNDVFL